MSEVITRTLTAQEFFTFLGHFDSLLSTPSVCTQRCEWTTPAEQPTFIRCTSLDDRKIGSEMTEKVEENAQIDPKLQGVDGVSITK